MRVDAFPRMMSGSGTPGRSAVLLADEPLRHSRLIDLMRLKGLSVTLSRTPEVLTHDLDDDVEFLFVDHESIGGITRVLEPLFQLRESHPAIIVCLLTDEQRSADYGAERRALTDATIFGGGMLGELEYALECAVKNNRKWQKRQLELNSIERR